MDVQLEDFDAHIAPIIAASLDAGAPEALGPYDRWGKRLLDIALVLFSAPLVAAIVAICAVLVALEGGRPFYWQARVGRGGVPFWMLKLRSMRPNADQKLASLIAQSPAAAAEWSRSQKLRHDPRVTRVGAVLRKTSIDELPQLWNVLTGQMSLVGPRPMMVSQSPLYPGSAYYRLRPGLTGPWQVFARNHRMFTARATYDNFYEQKLGLIYDFAVMWQTLRILVRGTGQ